MERVPISELDAILHDAYIDLDTIEIIGEDLLLKGVLENPTTRSEFGRYQFTLFLRQASISLIDDGDRLGRIMVMEIIHDPTKSSIKVIGATSGSIELEVHDDHADLEIESRPSQVKRWIKWRPVQG